MDEARGGGREAAGEQPRHVRGTDVEEVGAGFEALGDVVPAPHGVKVVFHRSKSSDQRIWAPSGGLSRDDGPRSKPNIAWNRVNFQYLK